MIIFSRTRIAAACLALSISAAWSAEEKVTLNFVNSDIESAIKAAGAITGKNFVIDPKVKGTVNIVSHQPVSRELVYPILLSALRQQGIAVVEGNGIVKVMPEAEAKSQGGPVLGKGERASGERILTQVYPLKFQSASQLVGVLKPLVTPNNILNAYAAGNTLVVTDYAENIARINRVIDSIDQPADSDFFALPLKHGSALAIAQTLGSMLPEVYVQGVQSASNPPEGVKRTIIVADVRSNQLLVRSEAEAHTRQIRALVESLDRPGTSDSNIHVIYLRNAEATSLAATLKGILTGQGGSTSTHTAMTPVSSSSSSSGSTTTAATPSSSNTPSSSAASVSIGGATMLIQADSMTNSLIITAPDHLFNNLRGVIDRLDVRRAQVYVEAVIAEVNLSKAGEFGVQWVAAGGNDKIGGGILSAIGSTSANLATLYSGFASGSLSIPAGSYLGIFNGDPTNGTASLGALAVAIQQSGDGNVLSTPNLLMLDNEEASITVGQNIPIVTGSYTTSSSGSTNPFTTVERKDVGIKLKVRPQVSDGGTITLTVSQEVSGIDSSVSTGGAGIATKVRTIDTKVLVDNDQTIVLGGLIQENVSLNQSKVPLLGDIPWLGQLFRYESRSSEKTNLMVFLRPRILRDSQAAAALSNERYQYLRTEQAAFQPGKNLLLPEMPAVTLPEPTTASPALPTPESNPASQPVPATVTPLSRLAPSDTLALSRPAPAQLAVLERQSTGGQP